MFQCRESRIFTISQRFFITNIKTEISSLWRCPHLHLLPIMENLPHHYHRHPSPPQHLLVTHLQSRLTPPPLESQGVVNRAVNEPSRGFSWWIVDICIYSCVTLQWTGFLRLRLVHHQGCAVIWQTVRQADARSRGKRE